MEEEAVFITKEICCVKQCGAVIQDLFGDREDDTLILAVVHEMYPYLEDDEIKAFLLLELYEDGSVEERPFSCLFYGEFARWADGRFHLGDAVCLYRPTAYVWKQSCVCPQLMDIRVLMEEGRGSRLLRFNLTGDDQCADCRSASPDSPASAAAARRRFPRGRLRAAPAAPTSSRQSAVVTSTSRDFQPSAASRSPAQRSPSPAVETARRGWRRGSGFKVTPDRDSPVGPTSESLISSTAEAPSTERSTEPSSTLPAERAEPPAGAPSESVPADAPPAADLRPTEPARSDTETIFDSQEGSHEEGSENLAADFLQRVPADEPSNVYTLLADVANDDPSFRKRPNLMGVIVGVPQLPRPTNRSYMVMVIIKDPSCRTGGSPRCDFVVFGFVSDPSDLPAVQPNHGLVVGNVLRARHVKVERHAGKLDGRVFRGSALTVFTGGVDDPPTPLGTRVPSPELSDAERARLRWLREWWAVERHHQERIAGAVDTTLADVLRPGLYSLLCKLESLETIGGEVFARVRDGTRCHLPCAEPRPAASDDEDVADDPAEPETQIFREQTDRVWVRLADRRCATTLRAQRAAGAQFLLLQRIRATDELSQQETCSAGLSFAMLPEDEPLVLPLRATSDEVLVMRERIEAADRLPAAARDGRAESPPPPPPPPSSDNRPRPTASGRPDPPQEQPTAAHIKVPTDSRRVASHTADHPAVTAAVTAAPCPTPAAVGSIFTDTELGTGTGPSDRGAQQPRPPATSGAACAQPAPSEQEQAENWPVTGTSSQESVWYDVQLENLNFSSTPSNLGLASQPGGQRCSQGSSGPAEGFVTAPQTPSLAPNVVSSAPPSSPSTVVTDAALPPVPFDQVSVQPSGRPFRTRCVLRGGVALVAGGDLQSLLIATCLQQQCRTQYRGAALPAATLDADWRPVYVCRGCQTELLLGLAIPLELHGAGGVALQALAAGGPAELLLSTEVRVAGLEAVRRRLTAVAAALRPGLEGQVGLLPLPEPNRRYLIVGTQLTGIPESECPVPGTEERVDPGPPDDK